MPRRCTVCIHQDREAIEMAIVDRQPYRDIAGRFGISRSAIERHRRDHFPEALAQAEKAESIASADKILDHLFRLQRRSLNILEKAEATGDLRTSLLAIREARGCIELIGRVAGELRQGQNIDITISPVWIEIRSKVLESLAPFPDARRAVAGALIGGSDDG